MGGRWGVGLLALGIALTGLPAASGPSGPVPGTDRGWLGPSLVGLFGLAVAGGFVAAYFLRLNRRLRREVCERRAAEEKLRGLLEQSTVGICILQDDRFAWVNARFSEIFGHGAKEMTAGMGLSDVAAEADRESIREMVRSRLEGRDEDRATGFRAIRKDGALIDVEMSGKKIDHDGHPAIVGMALDVTERVRAQRQLKYLAFYDPLTDLPNRALLYDRLGQALAHGRRGREPFALLMLDLDGFKAVNDVHGHETGDALLRAVGQRLQGCVRETDTVARIGGDEFVVLLSGLGDRDSAAAVAGKMLAALDAPFLLGARECRVGASIGICVSVEDGDDIEALLGRADAAMYESKANGKNRFTCHRPDLSTGESPKKDFLDLGADMNVGVPVIDRQHARLAELLNRVAEAVKSGQDRDRVAVLLGEVVDFTRHHFETEERLMEKFGYPGALAHGQEHRKLLADLASIRAHATGASLMLTLQSLKEWLVSHIAHGDRELGEALVARGAAAAPAGPGAEPA